jgi:hypothetical protein
MFVAVSSPLDVRVALSKRVEELLVYEAVSY